MAHRWNDPENAWRRQVAYAWIAAAVVGAALLITTWHGFRGIQRELDALQADIRAELRAFRNESRVEPAQNEAQSRPRGEQQHRYQVIHPKESPETP